MRAFKLDQSPACLIFYPTDGALLEHYNQINPRVRQFYYYQILFWNKAPSVGYKIKQVGLWSKLNAGF